MNHKPNRRRFLGITAAAAAALASPAAARDAELHVWNGTALGARASLRLCHPDRAQAEAAMGRCVAEIQRLEHIFSLYRPDSALSELNRSGQLSAPPFDLVRILAESRKVHRLTRGIFDVTVQPLWRLYAAHFGGDRPAADGPDPDLVAAALALVGQDEVTIGPDRIGFARTGMAVTLNGIAQGYITDRITEILRQEGFAHVLVDLGEARASGRRADGAPWRAALADPRSAGAWRELELRDCALATSAPGGFAFDAAGRVHHLFDPRSGRSAAAHQSASVLAPDATAADALSTAFVQMPPDEIRRVLAERAGVTVHLLARDGRHAELRSPRA